MKLCFIVSSTMTVTAFLKEHIRRLQDDYDITVITNILDASILESYQLKISMISVPIERKINIISDLRTLYQIYRILTKNNYDIVHSVTPKAGLLAQIASYLTHVPVRIHTFTGQVWVNSKGLSRVVFKNIDRLIAALTTNVLVDSWSQRDFLLSENVIRQEKSDVLLDGSICGVDTEKFIPDMGARVSKRKELGFQDNELIYLYLGRLSKDKGLLDLARAFSDIFEKNNDLALLIVGPDEDVLMRDILEICVNCQDKIKYVDYTDTPEIYMACCDIFILPSYREGFGNVVIEAAACGVPAIGTRIYGISDSIVENVTGILYSRGDIKQLAESMRKLATDSELRTAMGKRALERARKYYAQQLITEELFMYYQSLS